jgi:hypothetical protein
MSRTNFPPAQTVLPKILISDDQRGANATESRKISGKAYPKQSRRHAKAQRNELIVISTEGRNLSRSLVSARDDGRSPSLNVFAPWREECSNPRVFDSWTICVRHEVLKNSNISPIVKLPWHGSCTVSLWRKPRNVQRGRVSGPTTRSSRNQA